MISFSGVTISVDSDIAELVATNIKNADRRLRRLYRQRATQLAEDTVNKLATPAPPVKYPIQWKSRRQQRAFFATKGFGKGIPTQRTGALNRGWKFIASADFREGIFTVYNSATTRDYFSGQLVFYEQFVQGINQQPFHQNTGWIKSQDVLSDAFVAIQDILIDTWLEANLVK